MADNTDTQKLLNKLTKEYGEEKTKKLVSYIDKVLDRYKSYILWDTQDKIRDEMMF